MESEKIEEILTEHRLWMLGQDGGERADFSDADLRDAELSYADFSYADLSGTDLSGTDLRDAIFIGVSEIEG